MRIYYYLLCRLLLGKIQRRLVALVLHQGKDVRISGKFTAGELYGCLRNDYARGLRLSDAVSELRSCADTLAALLADADRILAHYKKEGGRQQIL